ncbi:leucine-rich repeat domain-containing protein [Shewanella goraebulensis]|uniref:hypothetical protein n=1 Tax=Shewanella goraebulensis TaxID=3050637 RepID=UPI00254A81E6|nr:hypothetical protein [Shewanella goraebulensis]
MRFGKGLSSIFMIFALAACNDSDELNELDSIRFESATVQNCFDVLRDRSGWENLSDIQTFSCSGDDLDAKGIEEMAIFTSLKELDISSSGAKDIDLSSFSTLEKIKLTFNLSLSSLHLSENHSLTEVSLWNNAEVQLDVANLVSLKTIDAVSNNMSYLNIYNTPQLESLNVMDNNLSTIDISDNHNLRTLHLDMNEFSHINLQENINLETLTIGLNAIQSIDLTQNTQLKTFDAGICQLTTINLNANRLLESVRLDNNPFDQATLDYLSAIDWIDSQSF